MKKHVEVIALVEGPTEKNFILQVLQGYLFDRNVWMTPIVLSKPGQKGGDVKFARAKNDIALHLKQRPDTRITLLVDYYGIRGDWPGYDPAKREKRHSIKAKIMNDATAQEVYSLFSVQNAANRFIPYISMYELEALLFSDSAVLSEKLGIKKEKIDSILRQCGEPEKINDDPNTAPSKRLEKLSDKFRKITTGIDIAKTIGIDKIRRQCPLFNAWLTTLESLAVKENKKTK